jgi:hypothetical protein
MPMTVYKFTSSLFGKLISLSAIIYSAYYNIAYGIILAFIFIFISEIGYLEGMTNKPSISNEKDSFIKEHCGKTKFNLETIDKDYPNLVFTNGACNPCDKSCRYTINNTSVSLRILDNKIMPKDA